MKEVKDIIATIQGVSVIIVGHWSPVLVIDDK